MAQKTLLNCQAITKSFGENHVLKGIDFALNSGEVIAIIGGNGAGKSTLMKIFMGIYKPDKGKIEINGAELKSINPSLALSNGVYMVPQEPMLFKNMTVLENVLIGLSTDKEAAKKKLTESLASLGWEMDLTRKADTLTIAEQQLVEILKGIVRESQVLILDEPTSSLTFNEIESLFKLIKDLREKGIGIIYITHRLNEVFEIATNIVIMRDGIVSLSGKVSEFNNDMLIQALLPDGEEGKTNDVQVAKEDEAAEFERREIFRLENFSGNGFKDINLSIQAGEILGLAGIVGAGRTELAETIFGKDTVLGGKVLLEGKDVTGKSTGDVIAVGINYVPEDRFKNGIFKIGDLGMNISASSLSAMGKVFLKHSAEKSLYDYFKERFKIKSMAISDEIGSLSGGNQQKVVIAKALASMPRILILDEPTRGIDAGARGDIYKTIRLLSSQGLAILLISSDMEEIVQLANRAVTMYRGRLNAEFMGSAINQENLISAAFGVVKKKEEVTVS